MMQLSQEKSVPEILHSISLAPVVPKECFVSSNQLAL